MRLECLPRHPAVAYLFLVRSMKRASLTLYIVAVAAMSTSALADTRKPYSLPMPYAPLPEYPAEARVKHWTGTGLFLVKADTDAGVVNSVTNILSTGHSMLDTAGERPSITGNSRRE